MLSAMGFMKLSMESGTPFTHSVSSDSVIRHAASREIPRTRGALAAAERRVPPQSGQVSVRRKRSTRFMPFSSFT